MTTTDLFLDYLDYRAEFDPNGRDKGLTPLSYYDYASFMAAAYRADRAAQRERGPIKP